MDLNQAQSISQEIVDRLSPHCRKIIVVGSIRRGKEFPRDIDIVLIPGNQGALAVALKGLGPDIKSGPKMYQCRYKGQQVDIYIADEQTWSTLLLIRTGSKDHNIKLCSRARDLGGKLYADGSGLEMPVFGSQSLRRIIPRSEGEIFEVLGLPYAEPKKRS